jgi:shikimate kinase
MERALINRLYITGFMGCGKSTVAPRLAGLLGYGCVDIDESVEHEAGKTVSEIFATRGEREFRLLERRALLATGKMDRVVVSLGGGTLTFGENDSFVKSAGVLVYLRVDFDTLFSRVREKGDRPLLRGGAGHPPGAEEVKRTMEKLFAEREPSYRRADLVIDAGGRDPGAVAEAIAVAIGRGPVRSPR